MAGSPADEKGPRHEAPAPAPGSKAGVFGAAAQRKLQAAAEAFTAQYKGCVQKLSPGEFLQAVRQFEKLSESPAAAPGFFAREIQALDETALLEKMAAPGIARYAPWLAGLQHDKDHRLSAAAEEYQDKMRKVAEESWHRLYDMQATAARVQDSIPGAGQPQSFALILNTLIDLKAVDDRARGFERLEDRRRHACRLDAAAADMFLKTAKASYAATSQRFHAMPNGQDLAVAQHDWPAAQDIVLAAFGKFSPELADRAAQLLKAQGTWEKEFTGRDEAVLNLGRCLAKAAHVDFAAAQGPLYRDIPPLLAQAAGVFGEALVAEELLSRENNAERQRRLLETVTRRRLSHLQHPAAIFAFERRLHDERHEKGEVAEPRIDALWQEASRDYAGITGAAGGWKREAAIFKSPFQSFDDLAAGAAGYGLLAAWQDSADKQGFAEGFMTLLKAGGARNPVAALVVFGLDAGEPGCWKKAFMQSAKYLDILSRLDRERAASQKFNSAAANDNRRPDSRKKTKGPQP